MLVLEFTFRSFFYAVAVDGDDVTGMVVSDITALMASRSEKSRRLTVITSTDRKPPRRSQESKHED